MGIATLIDVTWEARINMTIQLAISKTSDLQAKVEVEQFNWKLQQKPPENEVGYNKFSKTNYVPISFIQMTLDELFYGAWTTEHFETKVVANEIIGSIDLKYYHPELKTWITRVGAASVMIRQNKGANITDIGQKIKNGLVADYPHLLSSCIANAARSIGKLFGRDLNRDYQDIYKPVAITEQQEMLEMIKVIKGQINLNIKKNKGKVGVEEFKKKCVENKDNTEVIFWEGMLKESGGLNGTKV